MNSRMIFRQIVDEIKPQNPPDRSSDAAEVKYILPRRLLDDEAENRIRNRDANRASHVSRHEFAPLKRARRQALIRANLN